MKTRLSYVISDVEKSQSFEWTLKGLSPHYDLFVVLLNTNDSAFERFLRNQEISFTRKRIDGILHKISAFVWLAGYFLSKKPQVVHCHLYEAGYLGITAAWLVGIKHRIYTRHYSLIHHTDYPKGEKIDDWINRRCSQLVAISGIVEKVLVEKEHVPARKVTVIHHGFPLEEFGNISAERKDVLKERYGIGLEYPVIGVISRFIQLKGVQYIIPAFRNILCKYPDAILVLANAKGDYSERILDLLKEIPEKNYRLVEFEEDVLALYQLFDVFVHVPVGPDVEAFGQTYVEALASGVPCVFTISGAAHDFIEHEVNALVADYGSSPKIYESITRLLENKDLSDHLRIKGMEDVREVFTIDHMISDLISLYE